MKEVKSELLKSKEVMELLNISSTALWIYVNKGLIKSYRMGKRTIRFKRDEVLEILKPNVK